jgi:hypothetical protein
MSAWKHFGESTMREFSALFTICLAAALSGCGDAPEGLSTVAGTVTLDGQPLEGALVEFTPQEAGSPSVGRTDGEGNYELQFNRDHMGAAVGQHQVRISTYNPGDPEGDPPVAAVPEKVPAKYNVKTELTKTVEDGSNTIDFELDSKGEIITPDKLSRAGD